MQAMDRCTAITFALVGVLAVLACGEDGSSTVKVNMRKLNLNDALTKRRGHSNCLLCSSSSDSMLTGMHHKLP